jgi:hypothetical protein
MLIRKADRIAEMAPRKTIIICQLCGADVTYLRPKRGCYNLSNTVNMCSRCFSERYPEVDMKKVLGEIYVFDENCPEPKIGAVVR